METFELKFLDHTITYHDPEGKRFVGISPEAHIESLEANQALILDGKVRFTEHHPNGEPEIKGHVLSLDLKDGIPIATIAVKDASVVANAKGYSPGFVAVDKDGKPATVGDDDMVHRYALDHIAMITADDERPRKPFEEGDLIFLGAEKVTDEPAPAETNDAPAPVTPPAPPKPKDVDKALMQELKEMKLSNIAKEKEMAELQKKMDGLTEKASELDTIKAEAEKSARDALIAKIPEAALKVLKEFEIDPAVADIKELEKAAKLAGVDLTETKDEGLDPGIPSPVETKQRAKGRDAKELQEVLELNELIKQKMGRGGIDPAFKDLSIKNPPEKYRKRLDRA